MTSLPLTSPNACAGLHDACRLLRQQWPTHWEGLPSILTQCQQALKLSNTTDPDAMALNQFAWQVANAMENQALKIAYAEPSYHNRLHTADVLVSLTTLLRSLHALTPSPQAAVWSSALLAAAVAHDYQHPGGVNQSLFEIETASWQGIVGLSSRVPAHWRACIEVLILRTDPQVVAENHQCVADQAFEWSTAWAQVLLNEADILVSATAEFGPGLSEALAKEWAHVGFAAHATVATPAGRAFFLRSARFSSPAAKDLGLPRLVQDQLISLQHTD